MRNPTKLLQLKKGWNGFSARHPKLLRYLGYITDHYMNEGTVLDITVTDAEGHSLHSNARLTEEDVAFLREVRSALSSKDN